MELDDLELLGRYVRDGAEDAFAALVSRHVNMVYSVALRRIGDPDAAKEIAQVVFIILARKSKQLGKGTILPAWLHQTARLTAGQWARTQMRRSLREQEAYMQSLSNGPEEDLWGQVAPMLDDAIAGLGDKDRNAIVFRFFRRMNLGQVGAAMGTSEDAAHKRVNRAVEKLRNYFVKRGVAVSAGTLAAALSASSVQAAPSGLASAIVASAALKGTAGTGATLSVVKSTLKIMAWSKLKMGVVASVTIILAFGTGKVVGTRAVELQTTVARPRAAAAEPPKSQATRASSIVPLRWENIESTDYRQYIANMRAAGVPESAISDIIIADVHKSFLAQRRSIRQPESANPYWRNPVNAKRSGEQQRKIKELTKQECDVIQSLLGQKFSEQRFIDQICLQTGFYSSEASLSWLPPDKRDAARNAFDAADLYDDEVRNMSSPAKQFERRMALLADILTPEELEEYRLRESPAAEQIRNDARYANLTPTEFKALLQVKEQISDGKGDLESPDSTKRQTVALAKIVGEDRATEIIQKSSVPYHWIRQAVERYKLPEEAADQALAIRNQTESELAKIVTDQSLSKEDQAQRFAAVQLAARTAFVNCLGTNGAKCAYSGGADWLFFDIRSYALKLKRNL